MGSSGEDVEREDRRHHQVGDVDGLADPEVNRDTAECVGLLGVVAAGSEVVDHVQERIPRGERQVLALVVAVPGDADAGRGVAADERDRSGRFRGGQSV